MEIEEIKAKTKDFIQSLLNVQNSKDEEIEEKEEIIKNEEDDVEEEEIKEDKDKIEEKEVENKKCKNASNEEKEEKFEEEKEIAEKVENSADEEEQANNSMEQVRNMAIGQGSEVENTAYVPHSVKIEMGNNY